MLSRGRMIICSLHQPSFEILDMLDNVIVLDGGRTVFNGSVTAIIPRITRIKPFDFPEDISPVDYLLRLVNRRKTPEAEENVRLFELDSKRFNEGRSALSMLEGKGKDLIADPPKENQEMMLLKKPKQIKSARFQVNSFVKFWLLIVRGFKNLIQHKKLFFIFNFQMFLIMGITIGVYYNIGRDYDYMPPDGSRNLDIRDRIASLFFIAICYYCCILLNSSFSMEEESQVIYKEISGGMYSYGPYFWSKSFVDLFLLLPPVLVQIGLVGKDYSVLLSDEHGPNCQNVLHLRRDEYCEFAFG